jgi:hypothetical protein
MLDARLDRQARYMTRESQQNLINSPVVLIGEYEGRDDLLKDTFIQMLLMGVKYITLMGSSQTYRNETLWGIPLGKGYRVDKLKQRAVEMFPYLDKTIKVIHGHYTDRFGTDKYNLDGDIFDLTNDPNSKRNVLRKNQKKMIFSGSCDSYCAGSKIFDPSNPDISDQIFLEHFTGREQSGLTSMICSGHLVQEYVLRHREMEKIFRNMFWYRMHNQDPFSEPEGGGLVKVDVKNLGDIVIYNIGLGVVGCAAKEMQMRMGIRNGYDQDGDTIGIENLHAQAHYLYQGDDISINHSKKAEISSARLNKAWGANFIPINKYFWFDSKIPSDVNVVCNLVDDIFVRAYIDAVCEKKELIQIYAATYPEEGRAGFTIPRDKFGKRFPTMNDYVGLDIHVEEVLTDRRARLDEDGCSRQIDASLVPVNFIVGGMAAHLILFAAKPELYGDPHRQVLGYKQYLDHRYEVDPRPDLIGHYDPKRLKILKDTYQRIMRTDVML